MVQRVIGKARAIGGPEGMEVIGEHCLITQNRTSIGIYVHNAGPVPALAVGQDFVPICPKIGMPHAGDGRDGVLPCGGVGNMEYPPCAVGDAPCHGGRRWAGCSSRR